MRVLLKHARIDLYYAGRKHWVGNADSALDLETIERATEAGRDESFAELDILVTHDEPGCELILPLRRQGEAKDETRQAASLNAKSSVSIEVSASVSRPINYLDGSCAGSI